VSLLQSTDQTKGGADSSIVPVTLSSIHLAKGLEFDEVFVIGCNEGILPHARSYGSLAEVEEERRLLYVAMTRARKKLSLSFYDLPSRFLSELPQEFLAFEDQSGGVRAFDDEERYITLD
jgi:DNA helicase-2/ATP-dependent DNA helicase PcrA